jgi:HlyD family secretion protein
VDLNRRPVQHLEGGIVRAVLVRDGQRVSAGDPVLVLGDVGVDADRNRLNYRVSVERAALARLEAEQALARVLAFPEDLQAAARQDERVAQAMAKETSLFEARRDSLASELSLMRALRERVEQEMSALRAQIAQAENALALHARDLEANRGLLEKGFISPIRVGQIEASVVDYAAKLEERRSELARAAQRRVDADLKIRSIQNEYVQAASDQLKVTAARLAEIEQEQRKSEDAAARQVVAAPAAGEVIDLRITSPGAVVRPGEPIAEIVPTDARLVVEAHIRPEDVNHVSRGQRARVKFTAFKYRSTSMVEGTVTYVSADRLVDRATNMPYYSVSIVADAASLKEAGELTLQAGMPAEVYIEGTKQTALQYMMEPITSTIRKAGRQM